MNRRQYDLDEVRELAAKGFIPREQSLDRYLPDELDELLRRGRENQKRLLQRMIDDGFLPGQTIDESTEPEDVPKLLRWAESNLELLKMVSSL